MILTHLVTESTDGSVLLEGQLDFELRSSYNITIEAIDQGFPPKFSSKYVLIRVTDVYDGSPYFDKSLYETGLNWTVPVNTSVMILNASVPVKYILTGSVLHFLLQ